MERSVKNRNQLAAAVDQFDTTVGEKAGTAQSGLNEDNSKRDMKDAPDYQVLWNHYRQGIEASSKGELDYLVGYCAFEDGLGGMLLAFYKAFEATFDSSILATVAERGSSPYQLR